MFLVHLPIKLFPQEHFQFAHKAVRHDVRARLIQKTFIRPADAQTVADFGLPPELVGFFFTDAPMPVSLDIVFVSVINSIG
jgi:hypothetical protein